MSLPPELNDWFERARAHFERAYLAHPEPWERSGHFGSHENWERLRRPIAEAIEHDGALLDIGCANGYLLECLMAWSAERNHAIEPWGVDLSARLIELARERLPAHAARLFVANAFDWAPPRRFDWVRTGIGYVPPAFEKRYLDRLLDLFVAPGGALLVVGYRSADDTGEALDVDRRVVGLGHRPARVVTGIDAGGREGVRIAVVPRV